MLSIISTPGRISKIGSLNHLDNIFHSQMILGKFFLGKFHTDILRLSSGKRNRSDRRQLLHLRLNIVFHIVIKVSLCFIRNGKNHSRLGIDIEFNIVGVLRIIGQIAFQNIQLLLQLVISTVHIGAVTITNNDHGNIFQRTGLHLLHIGQEGNFFLYGLRNQFINVLGRCPGINGRHNHIRKVHVGEQFHFHGRKGDKTEKQEGQHCQKSGHRTAQNQFCDSNHLLLPLFFFCGFLRSRLFFCRILFRSRLLFCRILYRLILFILQSDLSPVKHLVVPGRNHLVLFA